MIKAYPVTTAKELHLEVSETAIVVPHCAIDWRQSCLQRQSGEQRRLPVGAPQYGQITVGLFPPESFPESGLQEQKIGSIQPNPETGAQERITEPVRI